MKNPQAPARIEPASFQFVVQQHLNHCATVVPSQSKVEGSKGTSVIIYQYKTSYREGPNLILNTAEKNLISCYQF